MADDALVLADLPAYETLVQADTISSTFLDAKRHIIRESVHTVRLLNTLYGHFNRLLRTDFNLQKLSSSKNSAFNKDKTDKVFVELEFRVGFIGCGYLGMNMIEAILKDGVISSHQIVVSTRRPTLPQYEDLKEKGVTFLRDNAHVARTCSVVFICTLRHHLLDVAKSMKIANTRTAGNSDSINAFRQMMLHAMSPPEADAKALSSGEEDIEEDELSRAASSETSMQQHKLEEDEKNLKYKSKSFPSTVFLSILAAVSPEKMKSVLQTSLVACLNQENTPADIFTCLRALLVNKPELQKIAGKARGVLAGMQAPFEKQLSAASY